MKILAISDDHGEDNENLYKYLNNNDIDIVIITGEIGRASCRERV